ncbi:Major allergen Mal d 1 [Linum grandiflorum]
MGVTTATHEFKSSIPAGRMYKAIVEESPTVFPKFMPNYKSELLQGDGGAGTILQTTFHDEGNQAKTVKHRVEAKDPANYHSKYTLIEGGVLGDNVESVENEVKIEGAGDGCVVKAINHYHTKGEADKALIEAIGQQTLGVYKALQDYLLANPSVCA